ncbi:hypothetical protein GCM10007052_31050 [Halioglobus japonicus]|uniref:AbiJ-related protein n=1 Tax=Halioglobus japonicus TaxID=930805 RepID=UPI00197AB8AE|nr:hypothetical protein GCM10007052_31050 [Halioglobus japonicus]
MSQRITVITRRDIIDAIFESETLYYGRLEETEFLSRVWELDSIPSTDNRFPNATGDIWQHTVNNNDWDMDWVFHDPRFELMTGDDETFLRFLCETVHPVVRSDTTECAALSQLYNQYLRADGYQLSERTRISGKPVYSGRFIGNHTTPGIDSVRETFSGADIGYITQQITRMESAVNQDPELAIGTAKELVETCCKSYSTKEGNPGLEPTTYPNL